MRTRNQSTRQHQPTGQKEVRKHPRDSEIQTCAVTINDGGTLIDVSHDAVGKPLKRVKSGGLRGLNKEGGSLRQCDSLGKSGLEVNEKQLIGSRVTKNTLVAECSGKDAVRNRPSELKLEGGSSKHASTDCEDGIDELDWEDGSVPSLNSKSDQREDVIHGVTIEFDVSTDSSKFKPNHRASAEDKELAELVHKVHLICLLGRGRLIDSACNDPLLQASLLSLLPTYLLNVAEAPKLTASALAPIVSWFHNNFHIRSPRSTERSFHSALVTALETHEGTPEEVAAMSVALFRALNLTTRFVSILDVASLKPDADNFKSNGLYASRAGKGIFNSSTLMVAKPNQISLSPAEHLTSHDEDNVCETSMRGVRKTNASKSATKASQCNDSSINDQLIDMLDSLACEAQNDIPDVCLTKKSGPSKRKRDLEFEQQLEMALSATAIGSSKSNIGPDVKDSHSDSSNVYPLKRMKKIKSKEFSTSLHEISTAIGSRKVGAPLCWAEVYCSGENMTGKWVHVDVVNAIIDGEQKVEASAAACKTSLRYVVAFAGHGAKDVTRRYCFKWYKIASQRINSIWWDAVLAPLKELESGSTGGVIHLKQEDPSEHDKVETPKIFDHSTQECLTYSVRLPGKSTVEVPQEHGKRKDTESLMGNSFVATRTSLEDMELETRELTEPLPTNQQAYRNHQLYAIERWLTKYQILYPKGPVLGFCSGHPVYPRTFVQILHTKERWLHEGLQVKGSELPAKMLKRPRKLSKVQVCEAGDHNECFFEEAVELYGKWQTEPLCLPHAVDGIVPKNERGQVEVWSEKCLPPGTVHLRLPRVAPVTKRLEIDFAPAMVGFEIRNGRSVPAFNGIVVCAEFKDAILAAYAEEEERREAEEKKRNESQALLRWYQLLSSIITRQRLNNCYGDGTSSQAYIDIQKVDDKCHAAVGGNENDGQSHVWQQRNMQDNNLDAPVQVLTEDHEHVFLTDDQTFDEESLTRMKKCRCGFSIQVEKL